MPIISQLIPSSEAATAVTIWICSSCGRDARLCEPATAPLRGLEFFTNTLGWRLVVDASETAEPRDVICDRCAPIFDLQEKP